MRVSLAVLLSAAAAFLLVGVVLLGGGLSPSVLGAGSAPAQSQSGRWRSGSATASEISGFGSRQPARLPPRASPPFARVRGLTLRLPVRDPVAIGYHEAAKERALSLPPIGRCLRNRNRTRFLRPAASEGPAYLVMASRGRPSPATSAVDVAMRSREPVLSPVTGRVARVKRYRLYGLYPDVRVSVAPAGRPRLRTTLIHLSHVRIRRGTRLVGGITVLGRARIFPFRSQVNDYVGPGVPHVHLEVRESGSSRRQNPP